MKPNKRIRPNSTETVEITQGLENKIFLGFSSVKKSNKQTKNKNDFEDLKKKYLQKKNFYLQKKNEKLD